MKQHLPILLLASLGLLGCGNYVTQAQLETTTNELRTDVILNSDTSALAVHECSMSRSFAQRAAEQCFVAQMHGANRERVGICLLLSTWETYCLAEDEDANLVVPRPGVINALDAMMQRLSASEAAPEAEETPATEPTTN